MSAPTTSRHSFFEAGGPRLNAERKRRAYRETKIRTGPPQELVDELLRAAVDGLQRLQLRLESTSAEERGRLLQFVLEVFWHLDGAIAAPESPLGQRLKRIYGECASRVVGGAMSGRPEDLEVCARTLGELRRAWVMTLPQG